MRGDIVGAGGCHVVVCAYGDRVGEAFAYEGNVKVQGVGGYVVCHMTVSGGGVVIESGAVSTRRHVM